MPFYEPQFWFQHMGNWNNKEKEFILRLTKSAVAIKWWVMAVLSATPWSGRQPYMAIPRDVGFVNFNCSSCWLSDAATDKSCLQRARSRLLLYTVKRFSLLEASTGHNHCHREPLSNVKFYWKRWLTGRRTTAQHQQFKAFKGTWQVMLINNNCSSVR